MKGNSPIVTLVAYMILKIFFRQKYSLLFFLAYFAIVLWWLFIFFSGQKDGLENYWFNIAYGCIALFGSVNGIRIAYSRWGGHRSIIGTGVILLSLGLFGEWFGNAVWGYANVVQHQAVPYPGLADIGFFSIIPLYGLAMLNFARASGVKHKAHSLKGYFQIILIPFVMLILSWFLFLKDIPFDLSNPLKLFLDYGYPAGEAIIVSIALLTYSLSKGVLGGKMRGRILFIIIALIIQYITDYTFLYTNGIGLYYNASFVDLLYATSLTTMSLTLLSFNSLE